MVAIRIALAAVSNQGISTRAAPGLAGLGAEAPVPDDGGDGTVRRQRGGAFLGRGEADQPGRAHGGAWRKEMGERALGLDRDGPLQRLAVAERAGRGGKGRPRP